MDFRLLPVDFAALPGWEDDDPSSLFAVMDRCLRHMRGVKPYRTGALGISSEALAAVFAAAAGLRPSTPAEARRFFEMQFQPFVIAAADGAAGFVTAFYEPEVAVSPTPSGEWRFPFYRRPADLVDLDEASRPSDMDASYAFGRQVGDRIDLFPDRRQIDCGALDGQGLEIAWARSRVDVFFAHVQGAARLVYPDGTVRRITYAAKAGHPFTGIGRHLVALGEIAAADVSMQTIRAWLAAHPDRQDEILWQNRSYIFFRDAPVDDPALGPIAAAKVALEPMRSIAVDRLIHTFSTPFYIHAEGLTHLTGGQPFRRLMMALDTGTAIVGPARCDLFTGSGERAGDLAGTVKSAADVYVLVPKSIAAGYLNAQ